MYNNSIMFLLFRGSLKYMFGLFVFFN